MLSSYTRPDRPSTRETGQGVTEGRRENRRLDRKKEETEGGQRGTGGDGRGEGGDARRGWGDRRRRGGQGAA